MKSFMKAPLQVGSSSRFIRIVNHYFTHFAGEKKHKEIYKYISQHRNRWYASIPASIHVFSLLPSLCMGFLVCEPLQLRYQPLQSTDCTSHCPGKMPDWHLSLTSPRITENILSITHLFEEKTQYYSSQFTSEAYHRKSKQKHCIYFKGIWETLYLITFH